MTSRPPVQGDRAGTTVSIDLRSSYDIENTPTVTDIERVVYSNLATVNVSHRDVFIDLLQVPGFKRDDTVHLPGVRVFMSYASAQKLAEALLTVLEKAHHDGGMEEYQPDDAGQRDE